MRGNGVGDFLGVLPLFAGLEAAALADIRDAAQPFSAAAGETLFRQDDPSTGLYIVQAGNIALATRTPGDDLMSVAEAGPGSLFGELSLLDGGRRSATATVRAAAQGLFISVVRFRGLMACGRPAAFEVLGRIRKEVARRTRVTLTRIAEADAPALVLVSPDATGTQPEAGPAEELIGMLRGLTRFSGLGVAEAQSLAAMGQRIDAPRGTSLARTDDRDAALHIVLRGAVRTMLPRAAGREQIGVHGPGELCGLVPLMDGERQPLDVEACEASILLRLDNDAFEALRQQPSELAHSVFDLANRQLVRDLRRATRHLGRAQGLARFNQAQGGGHV